MNVFEDLIEELKQENLLEASPSVSANTVIPQTVPEALDDTNKEAELQQAAEQVAAKMEEDLDNMGVSEDPREYYRKRAMEEVASLQMVEHIFSGIEREYMKIAPKSYDDLEVKKTLHKFLQVSGDLSSPAHVESEYKLMQETQTWITALADRDLNISVSNLRRFCENSRPVLSSQALMALSRFYRNSPGNEHTRAKFEFMMTKLFSRDAGDRKRALLFGHSEMIGHIKTLYANWSSISLLDADDNKDKVLSVLTEYKAYVSEFSSAGRFDELLESDLFNRYREFKEGLGDNFMLPEITAEAIDANVKLGNKYIDLIEHERDLNGIDSVEEKYGYTYDQVVSNAAGKTLLLVEVLRNAELEEGEYEFEEEIKQVEHKPVIETQSEKIRKSFFALNVLKANKLVLGLFFLALLVSGGLYFWANNFESSGGSVVKAREIDISNSDLRQYIDNARMTRGTFYAIIKPEYTGLDEEKQREFLKKVLDFAQERQVKNVNLLNSEGRTVAFANEKRLEVFRQ